MVFSQILAKSANPSIGVGQIWFPQLLTLMRHCPYAGPLQKTSPCAQKHKALRGTSSDGCSSHNQQTSLSSKFWKQCVLWSGNCQLPEGGGDRLELSFSQHPNHSNKRSFHLLPQRFITEVTLQALEGWQALQEHFRRISC